MPASQYSFPISQVQVPVRTGLSSLVAQSQLRVPFIPPEHPDRPHFPQRSIATVDCGYKGKGCGLAKNITVPQSGHEQYGNIEETFINALYPSNKFLNECITSLDRSCGEVTYAVAVPSEESYTVTLVFAANASEYFGVDEDVLNVEVKGKEKHICANLDPFALVGAYQPCVVSFENVLATNEITIRIRRSASSAKQSYLNGFVIVPTNDLSKNTLISPEVITVLDAGKHCLKYVPNVETMAKSEPRRVIAGERKVTNVDSILGGLASTCLTLGDHFGFDISVPEPGEYDVSVCFSELEKVEPGARIMNLVVSAIDVFEKKGVDICAEVGLSNPYLLTCKAMQVKDLVKVRVLAVKGHPVLSGVVVTKAISWSEDETSDTVLTTSVNCGSGNGVPQFDCGMEPDIKCTGPPCTAFQASNNAQVVCEDEIFAEMGRTCQRSESELKYTFTPRRSDITTYDVALVFCEFEESACMIGARVLNAKVKGRYEFANDIDIYEEVGALRAYVTRISGVEIGEDGTIEISVKKIGGQKEAILNGILIAPTAANLPLMQEPAFPQAFVSCGAAGLPTHIDSGATSNITRTGGNLRTSSNAVRGHPLLSQMGSQYRCGELVKYEVPISYPGEYTVILLFAECHWTTIGQRVFSIEVSGVETFKVEDIDIIAEVGALTPLVLQFNGIDVKDLITIKAIKQKEDALLCGFMIYESYEELSQTLSQSFVCHKMYNVDA